RNLSRRRRDLLDPIRRAGQILASLLCRRVRADEGGGDEGRQRGGRAETDAVSHAVHRAPPPLGIMVMVNSRAWAGVRVSTPSCQRPAELSMRTPASGSVRKRTGSFV